MLNRPHHTPGSPPAIDPGARQREGVAAFVRKLRLHLSSRRFQTRAHFTERAMAV